MSHRSSPTRRRFLGGVSGLALGSLFFHTPGAFADALQRTPRIGAGPLYPDKMPLDTDNDLLIINDKITPAVGQVTHLSGRVLDPSGSPIRNAVVEIWQADNTGVYINTTHERRAELDTNFQGFGRFLTGSSGEYYFRTIKPVPYPGRTPHIHWAVKIKGRALFTTECYVKGEPKNDNDGVFNNVKDPKARQSLLVDFAPIPGSRTGELAARFDLVLG
jgi:protocatechuate 3,4-dioxygenase beta subunit